MKKTGKRRSFPSVLFVLFLMVALVSGCSDLLGSGDDEDGDDQGTEEQTDETGDETGDDTADGETVPFSYESEGGEITLYGYTGSDTSVTVPASIDGEPVTALDEDFSTRDLTSITLPDTLKTIGETSFSGT